MEVAEKPMLFVKQQMINKTNDSSFVSGMYEKAESALSPEDEYVIKWSAASLYTGGADTVSPLPLRVKALLLRKAGHLLSIIRSTAISAHAPSGKDDFVPGLISCSL